VEEGEGYDPRTNDYDYDTSRALSLRYYTSPCLLAPLYSLTDSYGNTSAMTNGWMDKLRILNVWACKLAFSCFVSFFVLIHVR
jgi:hypothetical protein